MTSVTATQPRKRRVGGVERKGGKTKKLPKGDKERTPVAIASKDKSYGSVNANDGWFDISDETVATMREEFVSGTQDVTVCLFLKAVGLWMFDHPSIGRWMPAAITESTHVYLVLLWTYTVLNKAFGFVAGFCNPCTFLYFNLWRTKGKVKYKSESDTIGDRDTQSHHNDRDKKNTERTDVVDVNSRNKNQVKHLLYSVLASCAGVCLTYFAWLSLLRNLIYRQGTGELRQIIDEAFIWDRPPYTQSAHVTFAICVLSLFGEYLLLDAMQWLQVNATIQVATLWMLKLTVFKQMTESFQNFTFGNVAYNCIVPLCFGRLDATEMVLMFAPFAALFAHFVIRRLVFCY